MPATHDMRGVTWCVIEEVKSDRAIGGTQGCRRRTSRLDAGQAASAWDPRAA